MYRLLSIFVPSALVVFGVVVSAALRNFFQIPEVNVFYSIGAGLFFALIEVQILRKIDKNKVRYFLMDGIVFPFFSIGLAAGMFLG